MSSNPPEPPPAVPGASGPTSGQSQSQSSSSADGVLSKPKATGLVMQIILRRDLVTVHDWPTGPLMAQSAHAATAVLHTHRDHPDVQRYLVGDDDDGRAWEGMRKVVLEVPDEDALRGLAGRLDAVGIGHHLWIEQPENTPTALALVPNKRPKALKRILEEAGAVMWK